MAKQGQRVFVDYIGKFEDGTVFDQSSDHGDALDFVIGEGGIIPGFEAAVLDMEIGDTKSVTIAPEDGYGPRMEEAVQKVPMSEIPNSEEIAEHVGDSVYITTENNEQLEAQIVEVVDGVITFDFNHPMAGKTLIFDITLVKVEDAR